MPSCKALDKEKPTCLIKVKCKCLKEGCRFRECFMSANICNELKSLPDNTNGHSSNALMRYLGGFLVPSTHYGILIETP
jgi:hypothetical protein